jgi:hypothetical protein
MKLFGWKGAAAPRPVLSRASSVGVGMLGEWPSGYEAQVRAAVSANPVAQRAVRLVSEACGGAAVIASGASATENARALDLVRHVSAGQGLIETLALHLLLHGNGFVQIIPDADGEPYELFALRPERVSVDYDNNGWPVGYIYRVGERVTRLWAEDGRGSHGDHAPEGDQPARRSSGSWLPRRGIRPGGDPQCGNELEQGAAR